MNRAYDVYIYVYICTQEFGSGMHWGIQGRALVTSLLIHFYHPQRSCEGYDFTGVCLSTEGGVYASVHAGIPPPRSRHPPPQNRHPLEQTLPGSRHPPGAVTPQSRHPPGANTPQEETPPRADTRPPPPGADTPLEQTHTPGADPPTRQQIPLEQTPCPAADPLPRRDGYCCGRYASYWNAFFFFIFLHYSANILPCKRNLASLPGFPLMCQRIQIVPIRKLAQSWFEEIGVTTVITNPNTKVFDCV